MFYTADQIERMDKTYFRFPLGWHSIESKCGEYIGQILVCDRDGEPYIADLIVRKRP